MRRMIWFAIGFGSACALSTNLLWGHHYLNIGILLLMVSFLLYLTGRRWGFFRRVGAVVLGACLGFCWMHIYYNDYLRDIEPYDLQTVPLTVTATDYSIQSRYSKSVAGETCIAGNTYKVILYFSEDANVLPGDLIDGEFRLRIVTPSGTKSSIYSQGNGIFVTASQKGEIRITNPARLPIRFFPVSFSRAAKDRLDLVLPRNVAAVSKAILLGDTSDLSYQQDTALKISGIRHIVAVSGLHVSILFGFIFFICGKKRLLSFFTALPTLLVFAAMTGFTPSVVRACIMTLVMAAGWVLLEEYDSFVSLAFACLLMMLKNPFVVNSVSFQLSVASVTGILLFSQFFYEKIFAFFTYTKSKGTAVKAWRWVSVSLSVSISAQVFTVPLCAVYFRNVCLIAPLTNLLTIWAVPVIFISSAVIGFGGSGLIQCAASFVLRVFVHGVLGSARLLSSFLFASVYTQSTFIVAWLIISYIIFALYLVCGRVRGIWYASAVGFSLVFAVSLSVLLPRLDLFRLTVLDVGEGQCILLQSDGKRFLIDCGGDTDVYAADIAAETLLSQGVNHLDGIALTHYDYDHAAGLEKLLTRIRIDSFYFPDDNFQTAKNLAKSLQIESPIIITETRSLQFGNGILTFTEPGRYKTQNENCMCVLFESENCDILVTGDRSKTGEKRLIESMELPDVDILIGGHHGSKNSTSVQLLETVKPEIVIFSCGRNNMYGHPAQEVLERISQYGSVVYRTDTQGSVVIRR